VPTYGFLFILTGSVRSTGIEIYQLKLNISSDLGMGGCEYARNSSCQIVGLELARPIEHFYDI
jgi:hypothetical protein